MSLLLRCSIAALALASSSLAQAAWHKASSEHFIIYSEQKPEELKEFANRLERFDQAVRYLRDMDDPPLTDSNRLTVYVLHNDAALGRLYGGDALGFYSAQASGAAAFVPRVVGFGNDKVIEEDVIFFHEYAHHLQLQRASVVLPSWVVEGTAEFFSTARIMEDGGVEIGVAPKHRAYGLLRLSDLSLEKMVGEMPRKLTSSQFEQIYGRGWLLMHYLTFEPSRLGQLVRYIDGIQQGKSASQAAKAAFGDLNALDRELNGYFKQKKLPAVHVPANNIGSGPIAIRQLRAAEAALMGIHMRSERGVDRKRAPDVASDARRAASAYPNDPFAQAVLARAELDARNYAAAESAADRALAADPRYVRALIYKGRSRMELAGLDPAKADWKEIRSWFTRANKLDTENAEPLLLFYESYAFAGQQPTTNAIAGLLYATDLTPQDTRLRMLATIQLLRDNKLAESREMFGPLAYAPHAKDEWRETAAGTLDAIAAGDGAAALRLLVEAQAKEDAELRKR